MICKSILTALLLPSLACHCDGQSMNAIKHCLSLTGQVCEVTSLQRLVLSTAQGSWGSEHARRRSTDLQVRGSQPTSYCWDFCNSFLDASMHASLHKGRRCMSFIKLYKGWQLG